VGKRGGAGTKGCSSNKKYMKETKRSRVANLRSLVVQPGTGRKKLEKEAKLSGGEH